MQIFFIYIFINIMNNNETNNTHTKSKRIWKQHCPRYVFNNTSGRLFGPINQIGFITIEQFNGVYNMIYII